MIFENVAIIIPALNPDYNILKRYTQELVDTGFGNIIIVDDGSDTQHKDIFNYLCTQDKITVLVHKENRGKGEALKTAFKHVIDSRGYDKKFIGVITADSDGQHIVEDVLNVYKKFNNNSDSVVLGCRDFFETKNIPLRSFVGNKITIKMFQFLYGKYISDTQTGLRAIPYSLLEELIEIRDTGFDYETTMLVNMVHNHRTIFEVPIKTIYVDRNTESHFRPIRDSIKIYVALFAQFIKYSFSSLTSTFIELIIFQILVQILREKTPILYIYISVAIGRICALFFNYHFNKKVVFGKKSKGSIWKYALLGVGQFIISSSLIILLCHRMRLMELPVKIIVDTAVFLITYQIQNRFIFNERDEKMNMSIGGATDWNKYYQKPKSRWSTLTQHFTMRYIKERMSEIGVDSSWAFCECGGGNSCFASELIQTFNLSTYDIIDNCEIAIEKANNKFLNSNCFCIDLKYRINSELKEKYDLVYSIGLIEHFSDEDRKKVIDNHFAICKPRGYVLITAPTPTLQYRFVRKIMELFHVWQFWDEVPMKLDKMVNELSAYGNVIHANINRRLPLTQAVVMVRKFLPEENM